MSINEIILIVLGIIFCILGITILACYKKAFRAILKPQMLVHKTFNPQEFISIIGGRENIIKIIGNHKKLIIELKNTTNATTELLDGRYEITETKIFRSSLIIIFAKEYGLYLDEILNKIISRR